LERTLKDNLAARVKHGASAPEKFVDSEVDLAEALKRLGSLAAAPELYTELVRLGAVPTLLSLLAHDNGDIAADAADVLRELTDGDAVQESDEALAGGAALGDALVRADGLPSLLAALQRFTAAGGDEDADVAAAAVHSVLGVIENLADISGDLRDAVLAHPPVLAALLDRLAVKGPVDENRVYAAEVLAILLAGPAEKGPTALGSINGVDRLLRAIAPYRKKSAAAGAASGGAVGVEAALEEEFVENCFDCICSTLLVDANRLNFVENEGVELMVMIIRAKSAAKTAALKALDFALLGCKPAAERLVDASGLGAVFAAFAGRSAAAARKKRGADAAQEEEQRAVSLVSALLTLLIGERHDRVAAKFVEDGYAKVDRATELWNKYAAKTAAAAAAAAEEDGGAMDEEERYVARLDAGLFTLQQLALILGQLWAIGEAGINERMMRGLTLGGASLADVRTVLREYSDNLGDSDQSSAAGGDVDKMKAKVQALVQTLYADAEQRTPTRENEREDASQGDGEQPDERPAEGLVDDDDEEAA